MITRIHCFFCGLQYTRLCSFQFVIFCHHKRKSWRWFVNCLKLGFLERKSSRKNVFNFLVNKHTVSKALIFLLNWNVAKLTWLPLKTRIMTWYIPGTGQSKYGVRFTLRSGHEAEHFLFFHGTGLIPALWTVKTELFVVPLDLLPRISQRSRNWPENRFSLQLSEISQFYPWLYMSSSSCEK